MVIISTFVYYFFKIKIILSQKFDIDSDKLLTLKVNRLLNSSVDEQLKLSPVSSNLNTHSRKQNDDYFNVRLLPSGLPTFSWPFFETF